MKAFEEGQRVVYRGLRGPGLEWDGRDGVVEETYRDYDGYRAKVLLDGETKSWSFDVEDLELVKQTYYIENTSAESSLYVMVPMELTDAEAALIQRVIAELEAVKGHFEPTLSMERKEQEKK